MNFVVNIDCKFVVALGMAAVMTIFAVKMDPEAVKEVSTHVVDAAKVCSCQKRPLLSSAKRRGT